MKHVIAALCFVLAAPISYAQDKGKDAPAKAPVAVEKAAKSDAPRKEPTEKQKAQQARMKDCAAKAGDRKGEERNKFMGSCLKGGAAVAPTQGAAPGAKTAQQDRMKACNKQAADKKVKGDDRKAFMKECLST